MNTPNDFTDAFVAPLDTTDPVAVAADIRRRLSTTWCSMFNVRADSGRAKSLLVRADGAEYMVTHGDETVYVGPDLDHATRLYTAIPESTGYRPFFG